MGDREKLDDLIRELTRARRDQVEAHEAIQAALRRKEEARLRAQELDRAITTLIDQMTFARVGETFGVEQDADSTG